MAEAAKDKGGRPRSGAKALRNFFNSKIGEYGKRIDALTNSQDEKIAIQALKLAMDHAIGRPGVSKPPNTKSSRPILINMPDLERLHATNGRELDPDPDDEGSDNSSPAVQ